MALELKLSNNGISQTGDRIYLLDSTGDYDSELNTTGYGSPNTARASLALFLISYSKRFDTSESITDTKLSIQAYDPETVSQFETLITKDGWVFSTVYGLGVYDVNTEFDVNEITYDTVSNEVRRILTKSGSGPYTYTYDVIATEDVDAALENESYTTMYSSNYSTYSMYNINVCYEKAIKTYLVSNEEEDRDRVDQIQSHRDSATINFSNEYETKGQQDIEKLEDLCECFDDVSCSTC